MNTCQPMLAQCEVELALGRLLDEPTSRAVTLVLLQLGAPEDTVGVEDGDLLGELEAAAARRVRRRDAVGRLDERTLAVVLVGATLSVGESVAVELEEQLRPVLMERAVTHGLAAHSPGLDAAAMIEAARADLERRRSPASDDESAAGVKPAEPGAFTAVGARGTRGVSLTPRNAGPGSWRYPRGPLVEPY